MKTLEALYQEILSSEEKKQELAQAAQDEKELENWVQAQGCDATKEQVQAFLKEKQEKTGELSDDELSAAAGGCNGYEAGYSVLSFGLVCVGRAIESAAKGTTGPKEGTDKLLCHYDE